jgi:hypothetical protein
MVAMLAFEEDGMLMATRPYVSVTGDSTVRTNQGILKQARDNTGTARIIRIKAARSGQIERKKLIYNQSCCQG